MHRELESPPKRSSVLSGENAIVVYDLNRVENAVFVESEKIILLILLRVFLFNNISFQPTTIEV